MAFRLRVRRQENGDVMRADSRLRAAEVTAKRDRGELPPRKQTEAQRLAVNAAGRRYRARLAGRAVPIQKAGKPVLLLKPICRIRDDCPLASYCVDKEPNDRPLASLVVD